MNTCDRCKTENLDGSQYCDECGAPLLPNGRAVSYTDAGEYHPPNSSQAENGGQSQNGSQGQNGSYSPPQSTQPEFAGGRRVSAGLSLSSGRQSNKPHARLVIEKGRSRGKQLMLS